MNTRGQSSESPWGDTIEVAGRFFYSATIILRVLEIPYAGDNELTGSSLVLTPLPLFTHARHLSTNVILLWD